MNIDKLIYDLDELVVITREDENIGVSKWLSLNSSVADIKELLEKQLNDRWISVSERLPEESDIYLATFIENGKHYVERFYYSAISGWMMPVDWQDEGRIDKIKAWKPLPEPYGGEANEG